LLLNLDTTATSVSRYSMKTKERKKNNKQTQNLLYHIGVRVCICHFSHFLYQSFSLCVSSSCFVCDFSTHTTIKKRKDEDYSILIHLFAIAEFQEAY